VFNTQYDIIKEVGRREFNWKLSNRDPWTTQIEWDIIWADVAPMLERWKEMKPFQKINHFPGMYQIARKNYLARNLNKMQKQFPGDYKFFPKTWLLPHQLEDLKNYALNNPAQQFIVKPEALS
jgi:tubulin polyglutamylase TTLL6/13